jgi:hypothetical protein
MKIRNSLLIVILILPGCAKNKIKTAHIYGRVTDAATGQPRKNFKILINGEYTDFLTTLFTDENGQYSLKVDYSGGKKTQLKS